MVHVGYLGVKAERGTTGEVALTPEDTGDSAMRRFDFQSGQGAAKLLIGFVG